VMLTTLFWVSDGKLLSSEMMVMGSLTLGSSGKFPAVFSSIARLLTACVLDASSAVLGVTPVVWVPDSEAGSIAYVIIEVGIGMVRGTRTFDCFMEKDRIPTWDCW